MTRFRRAFAQFSFPPRRAAGYTSGMRSPHRFPLGVVILLACALHGRAAEPTWEPVPPAALAEEKPQLEPEAAAEVLDYKLDVVDRIEPGTKSRGLRDLTTRMRLKIYDPARATEWTRIARFWGRQANLGYEIAARLTLPDGTVRTFGKDDLRSRSVAHEGHANGLLGSLLARNDWDAEEKFLAITGVVKGAILDVWENDPGLRREDLSTISIQRYGTPIRRFAYRGQSTLNADLLHRVYVLNAHGGKLVHDEKGGLVTFTVENLPALVWEAYQPPTSYSSLTIVEAYENLEKYLYSRSQAVSRPKPVPLSIGPWAMFSTEQDYHDADMGYITRHARDTAAELTAGAPNEREKARRLYAFVQSRFQRFKNRANIENLYFRYVDSVDNLIDLESLNSTVVYDPDFDYLLIALARSAGLECHSVFHPDRPSFRFSTDFVSASILWHRTVALKVDGAWVICDPCSEVPLGFGQLLWQVENQLALMAMPQQQIFLNVPSPAAETSLAETKADLTLAADGTLAGECTRTFTGHAAFDVREKLHRTGAEHWWNEARALFGLDNSSAEIRLLGVEGLAAPDEPVRVRAFIRWPAYAAKTGARFLIAPAIFQEGQPPLLSASTRKTPVFFNYPREEHDLVTVHLSAGVKAAALPKPITASTADFAYTYALAQPAEGGTLTFERDFVRRAVEISVENYPAARDWLARVSAADQITIVLAAPAEKK